MKTINLRLKNKVSEVFFIPPNDLGFTPLTRLYKLFTHPLKTAPFIIVVPLSLLAAIVGYYIFGYLIVRLASLLQYGF